MKNPILFYFDFSSPYGYLASLRIDAIAAQHGREVAWKPILLGAIFKASGNTLLVQQPLKGKYSMHDFARSARWFKAPYQMPSVFPIATQNAARAFYWLNDSDPALAKVLAQRLFAVYFAEGRDISSAETVIAEGKKLGVDPDKLAAALADQAIKDRLRVEVEKALELGVCGSPYTIVDGEPFWGADRLDQVDAWLKIGGW
jgi:2-hydroxychromene-2-carboxylate isomerase